MTILDQLYSGCFRRIPVSSAFCLLLLIVTALIGRVDNGEGGARRKARRAQRSPPIRASSSRSARKRKKILKGTTATDTLLYCTSLASAHTIDYLAQMAALALETAANESQATQDQARTSIRVVMVSDTHNDHRALKVPAGDVVRVERTEIVTERETHMDSSFARALPCTPPLLA